LADCTNSNKLMKYSENTDVTINDTSIIHVIGKTVIPKLLNNQMITLWSRHWKSLGMGQISYVLSGILAFSRGKPDFGKPHCQNIQ